MSWCVQQQLENNNIDDLHDTWSKVEIILRAAHKQNKPKTKTKHKAHKQTHTHTKTKKFQENNIYGLK